MNDVRRLLSYARPYLLGLFASVIFMAIVGLSQGLLLRLIPLVFDRVLKPDTPDAPALLFSIPHTDIHLTPIQLRHDVDLGRKRTRRLGL